MKIYKLILVALMAQFAYAQPSSIFLAKKKKVLDTIPKWENINKASFDLSEVAFVNWSSGGSNSISGLLGIESKVNYKYKHFRWKNNGALRYGLNKQQDQGVRKTDDAIAISSNLGYKKDTLSNWFYSAKLDFRTQLTNGYNYPDKDNEISKFMAPGYLFFGGGMEYGKDIEELSFYFSPLTLKATFVLDDALANVGAFGVVPAVLDDEGNVLIPGERFRREVGILMTNGFEKKLAQNISMVHLVSLYTDYINSFGNIDLDWQINFDFKVNNYVRATLGSHLKYDDDVKLVEETDVEDVLVERGPKVQWKQLLGVGVVVGF